MAIITTQSNSSTVVGVGTELTASVNLNGALMEMLATVYSNILLAAIRESIQNACDANRNNNKSLSEIMVTVPTKANPMFSIIDRGKGMSKEFMETTYLSFGSSTKAGNNGAAGGLGVGRWAAYGYIRECYIITTHESDMIERTYFQYQGEDNMPKVQLASEKPGTVAGTQILFPVKESDVVKAHLILAWLKEIMQLTLNDSFSTDFYLESPLPEYSGFKFHLGDKDPFLKDVYVYPFQGGRIQYSGFGLQTGSLLVTTNKDKGVGGLPFNVNSSMGGIFSEGCIIEVPMSLNIPFMPSREEIKYTDEMNELLARINSVTEEVVVERVKELYDSPCLTSKQELCKLIGGTDPRAPKGYFAYICREGTYLNEKFHSALKEATGGIIWTGRLVFKDPTLRSLELPDCDYRYLAPLAKTMNMATFVDGSLSISANKSYVPIKFALTKLPILVVNDVPTGGLTRFRHWVKSKKECSSTAYLFIASKGSNPDEAMVNAEGLNSCYANSLSIIRTSSLPVVKSFVGTKVLRRAPLSERLVTYSFAKNKQEDSPFGLLTGNGDSPDVRCWIQKDGSTIQGFKPGFSLNSLVKDYGLNFVNEVYRFNELYLLTSKQVKELNEVKSRLCESGHFEMPYEEFDDDPESQEILELVKVVKSYVHFEDKVKDYLQTPEIQSVIKGEEYYSVAWCSQLGLLCEALAETPRLNLIATKFDNEISKFVDIVSSEIKIKPYSVSSFLIRQCRRLTFLPFEELETDSDERKEMIRSINLLTENGTVDYREAFEDLLIKFPLLRTVRFSSDFRGEDKQFKACFDHLCEALALLYH